MISNEVAGNEKKTDSLIDEFTAEWSGQLSELKSRNEPRTIVVKATRHWMRTGNRFVGLPWGTWRRYVQEGRRYWPGKPVPPLLLTQHPPISSGVNTPIFYRASRRNSRWTFFAASRSLYAIYTVRFVYVLMAISFGLNCAAYAAYTNWNRVIIKDDRIRPAMRCYAVLRTYQHYLRYYEDTSAITKNIINK